LPLKWIVNIGSRCCSFLSIQNRGSLVPRFFTDILGFFRLNGFRFDPVFLVGGLMELISTTIFKATVPKS
jgi:hypothetical protein